MTSQSPPGSSVHGISQARLLEWVAISFSRGSFWPRDQTQVSCIADRFSTVWVTSLLTYLLTIIWYYRYLGTCKCSSEKAMAPHSSTLAWKIPWTERPGRLQSMGLLRVGHDWAISLSLFTFHELEKEMATHSSVLAWRIPGTGEPGGLPSMGLHSQTWLKRCSSSSSKSSSSNIDSPGSGAQPPVSS